MTMKQRGLAPTAQMQTIGQIQLVFSDWRAFRHIDDPFHKNLSAVARMGDSLFLACDETASVERLRRGTNDRYDEHRHFALDKFVDLPAGAAGEMDIEGLCAAGGYLWIVGSHALKRSKPKRKENSAVDALRRMEYVDREPNRYFFGRIPLIEEAPGVFTLSRTVGDKRAAWAKFGKSRSSLVDWLADDPHLAPYLTIPSKENGFDVEGLAVQGDEVWLGLRGPVLSGHAAVLRLVVGEKTPGQLIACKFDHGRRYRKYMIDTRGLGIRDMRWQGADLLLLVGPTMALYGPAFVLSWRDAINDDVSSVIDTDRIKVIAELPYHLHADHPEGLDLWPEAGANSMLIIYDAPAPERTDPDQFMVHADVVGPST